MSLFVQTVIIGLLMSGVYALMSSGLVLTYGVMRVINLAQGAFVILGAYLSWSIFRSWGMDPFVSVLLTFPLMFAVGVTMEYLLLRPLSHKRTSFSVLMTWGMALGVEGLLVFVWGSDLRSIRPSYVDTTIQVLGYTLPVVRVLACILSVAALVGLYSLLQYTRAGKAIRAASENPEAARLLGIDPARVSALAFGLGMATASLAGVTFGLIASFNPASHYDLYGKLLTIVVLGGLGSFRGALVAAVVLGVTEALVQVYISPSWALFPFYALLIAMVALRPEGLFGDGRKVRIA